MSREELEATVGESIQNEADALQKLISTLKEVSPEVRDRLIQTVVTFFNINLGRGGMRPDRAPSTVPKGSPSFSDDRAMSPKEFLLDKQPKTDVERVACLAYYLTHYRDTPHFKTLDISKLNTESAQRKFTNTAKAVDNATRNEYLVPSSKGQKQLGAIGEVFVQELPDRVAAKSAVNNLRPTRKRASKRKSRAKV